MLGNQPTHARFDFGVAVRTEQHALGRLGAKLLDRPRQPATTEPETLRLRIDVMKVERSDAAVVSAEPTTAPGLVDEHALRALAAAGDRLGRAACKRQCPSARRTWIVVPCRRQTRLR